MFDPATKTYMVTVRFHLRTTSTAEETSDVVAGWLKGQVGEARLEDVTVTAYEDALIKETYRPVEPVDAGIVW